VNRKRLLSRLLAGSRNVSFSDFQGLVEGFGFRLVRIRGSHHIFSHPDIPDKLNVQPLGGHAKAYQIHQLLSLVEEYNLHLEED
jgi:predicted RNA binding protein YcfA (HicA-like mRNA interferase family)